MLINSVLFVIGAGCSQSGPELAPVTGKVSVNGQPFAGMIVEFQPVGKSPSIGVTDHDGRFKLRFSRDRWGALIGEHLVKIDHDVDGRIPKSLVRIPARYNIKSELKRQVVKGSNSFDFELQADTRPSRYR